MSTKYCARCGGELHEGEPKKLAQPPSDSGFTLEHHDPKHCIDFLKQEKDRLEQLIESNHNALRAELEEMKEHL